MKKYFVLLNLSNNKYWTGRFWDIPYSSDINDANKFDSEDEVDKFFQTKEEENIAVYIKIQEIQYFKLEIIYSKQ